MDQIQTDRDLFPDYPATFSFIRKLDCVAYSAEPKALCLHYSNPVGLLKLTYDELLTMNDPDFIKPYQKDVFVLMKEDVLTAIKAELGKEIIYMR